MGCCDEDDVSSYPADPPPCTESTCSFVWRTLRESGGKLSGYVRLRGGSLTKQVGDDCLNEEDCGVLRCYVDRDGNDQGIDIDLFGDPTTLEDVTCLDEDGNSLYTNPLRRIKNVDGSCSLGTLPFPIQDTICSEGAGCDGFAPPGQDGDVHEGCAPQVCATIENRSCYPMIVVPKMTIEGAELGGGPVRYEVQANTNGNFEEKIPVFSSAGGCTATMAGTGATSSAGDPAHTHEGPDHTHTVDCGGGATYTGTTEFAPVEIAAGASFTFCITPSIRYTGQVDDAFPLDFGKVRVCVDGRSKLTPETIAALEGA